MGYNLIIVHTAQSLHGCYYFCYWLFESAWEFLALHHQLHTDLYLYMYACKREFYAKCVCLTCTAWELRALVDSAMCVLQCSFCTIIHVTMLYSLMPRIKINSFKIDPQFCTSIPWSSKHLILTFNYNLILKLWKHTCIHYTVYMSLKVKFQLVFTAQQLNRYTHAPRNIRLHQQQSTYCPNF